MTPVIIAANDFSTVRQLAELEEICFDTDRLSTKHFRRFIQSGNAEVLMIKQNELLIGSAVILFRSNSSIARLYSIAIHPNFRGQGAAEALLTLSEKQAIARRATEIRLEVKKENQRALRFYAKNNYKLFGEYKNFYEDQADAWRMHKRFDHTT